MDQSIKKYKKDYKSYVYFLKKNLDIFLYKRKHLGQTKVDKWIKPEIRINTFNLISSIKYNNCVSEMCVS